MGAASLAAACSAKDDDLGVATDPGLLGQTGGGGMPAGAVIDAGPTQTNDPVMLPDSGGVTYLDAGFTGEKCVATKAVAPPASTPKVDIVWVVDSSQSMFGEQNLIKANLAMFADAITKASVDVSIVMVSKYPTLIPGPFQVPGLCPDTPPDPLAGTPLAMDPRYHFVNTEVGSPDPLNVAIGSYGMYSQFLRPGSAVHFIVVSDDEAQYKGAASAQARAMQFQADMMGRLGRPFTYHTISSPPGMRCSSPNCAPDPNQGICALIDLGCQAANGGDTHYALATLTKGLSASICEPDWSRIFKMFQEAVIKSAPLPCDYNIPPPPKNEKLDAAKVNVHYTPVGGAELEVKQVPNAGACSPDKATWYYDNPAAPTKVNLCPGTCKTVESGGAMNIVYGCETVVLN
jgi:hypothetical protein